MVSSSVGRLKPIIFTGVGDPTSTLQASQQYAPYNKPLPGDSYIDLTNPTNGILWLYSTVGNTAPIWRKVGGASQGLTIQGVTPVSAPPSPQNGQMWVVGNPVPSWVPDQFDGTDPVLGDGIIWSGSEWVNLGPLRGPQGLTGTAGTQGIQGATGSQGPVGATGPQGAPGTNGTNGAAGAAGPTGPGGMQGATGPMGPQGTAGARGNVWHTGAGLPPEPLPNGWAVGDFYLNTDNGDVYQL